MLAPMVPCTHKFARKLLKKKVSTFQSICTWLLCREVVEELFYLFITFTMMIVATISTIRTIGLSVPDFLRPPAGVVNM